MLKNKKNLCAFGLVFLITLIVIVKFVPAKAYSMGPFHFDSFECMLQDGTKKNLEADVTVQTHYNGVASCTMTGRIEVPDWWDFNEELHLKIRTTLCNNTWQDCILQLSDDKKYWTVSEPGLTSSRDDGTNYKFGYEYMCTAGPNNWSNWVFFYNGDRECIGRFLGTPQGDGQITFDSPTAPNSYDGKKLVGWSLSRTEYLPVNGSASEDDFHFINDYNIDEGPLLQVYAYYEDGAVNVSFDPNGGGGTAPEDITYLASASFAFPDQAEFSREGYQFMGWGDTETAYADGGTVYQPGEALVLSDPGQDKIYYAQWAEVLTVCYDLNGCPATPPQETEYIKRPDGTAEAAAAPADGITWAGRDFLGYSKAQNSETAELQPGDTFTISENTTLYAVWKKRSYTISFQDNGAIEPSGIEDMTMTIGETADIPSVNLRKDYYVFKGWNTMQDGSGTSYPNGGSVTIDESAPENLVLYAKWEAAAEYKLHFEKGDGDVLGTLPPDAVYYEDGINHQAVLPKSQLTRAGYTFSGWSTSKGGNAVYQDEGTFTITGNTTLYPVWTAGIFTLSYDFNGNGDAVHGAVPESVNGSLESGTLAAEQGNMFREFYRFTGWNTMPGGGGAAYAPNAVVPLNHNMTLYAMWESLPPLSITYHKNCDDGLINVPLDTASYYADGVHQSGNVSMDRPIRFGYEFTGWNTKADGKGSFYTAGKKINILEDTILYAQWKRLVNVSFDNTDGNLSGDTSLQVYEGTKLGDVKIPAVNQGYVVKEWIVNGKKVTDYKNYVLEKDADVVLVLEKKKEEKPDNGKKENGKDKDNSKNDQKSENKKDSSKSNGSQNTGGNSYEGGKNTTVNNNAKTAGTGTESKKKLYKTEDSDYSAGYLSPVEDKGDTNSGETGLTNIEDEQVPLSAGALNAARRAYGSPKDCMIHWLILLGSVLSILYAVLRCRFIRRKNLLQSHFLWDSLLMMTAIPISAAAWLYQSCKWDILAIMIWMFITVMALYANKITFHRNLEDMEAQLLLAEEEYQE